MSGPIAGWQQGASYPAASDRALAGATAWSKNDGSGHPIAMNGVIWNGYGHLQPAFTTGWQVTVQPGSAMCAGYTVRVPSVVTLTHDAATGTARRDLIIVRVKDQEAGDASDSATVEIVKGTTTADPALPSTRCMILARVNVRASSSALLSTDVVDSRFFTAAAGGVVVGSNVTTNAPPDVALGALIYDRVTGYHSKMAADGVRPLSPVGSAIYTSSGVAMTNGAESGVGALTKHPNTVGDTAFVSPGGANTLVLHPLTGLYTVTFAIELDRFVTGPSWIQIAWPSSPASYRIGIPQYPSALASATVVIGPPAEVVVTFTCWQESGATAHANTTITVTRWS